MAFKMINYLFKNNCVKLIILYISNVIKKNYIKHHYVKLSFTVKEDFLFSTISALFKNRILKLDWILMLCVMVGLEQQLGESS